MNNFTNFLSNPNTIVDLNNIDIPIAKISESKSSSHITKKKEFFSYLEEGLEIYDDIQSTQEQGVTFYKQIQQYISSLKIFIYDFMQIRKEERDKRVAKLL